MVRISPSIIATDYKNNEELIYNLKRIEKSSASLIHLDVMDGKFVKNITFDESLVSVVRDNTTLLLDVHLMVEKPENVVKKYIEAGADIISFHIESTSVPNEVIDIIKKNNCLCGIAISPNTSISSIKEFIDLNKIDMVLLMSVEPGEYGQKFLQSSFERLAEIREISKSIQIEVDGGVNFKNCKILRKLGANILVSGATVFTAKNLNKAIKTLKGNRFIDLFR